MTIPMLKTNYYSNQMNEKSEINKSNTIDSEKVIIVITMSMMMKMITTDIYNDYVTNAGNM